MVHSFSNARDKGENCLDTLNVREVPTRRADNLLWAVANNSWEPYSHWGSFIARPGATSAKQLPINQPGMLVHDFPDTLSAGGWYHNHKPMNMPDDELIEARSGHVMAVEQPDIIVESIRDIIRQAETLSRGALQH